MHCQCSSSKKKIHSALLYVLLYLHYMTRFFGFFTFWNVLVQRAEQLMSLSVSSNELFGLDKRESKVTNVLLYLQYVTHYANLNHSDFSECMHHNSHICLSVLAVCHKINILVMAKGVVL